MLQVYSHPSSPCNSHSYDVSFSPISLSLSFASTSPLYQPLFAGTLPKVLSFFSASSEKCRLGIIHASRIQKCKTLKEEKQLLACSVLMERTSRAQQGKRSENGSTWFSIPPKATFSFHVTFWIWRDVQKISRLWLLS